MLLLAALVAFAIGRPRGGGALTLSYFLGLSLVHVPGVLPFLGSDSGLIDGEETRIGFEMTLLGVAAFVLGAILARRIPQGRAPARLVFKKPREQAFLSLGRRALALGIVAYFVLIPLSFRVQSLTSLVSPLGTLLILGFWLAIYGAAEADDRRTIFKILALMPLLPFATLVTGGYLGAGIYWVLSVIAFLFVITRRRIWFYVAAAPAGFLGLSLFCTYISQRGEIRELVWHEQSGILDRIDRVSGLVTGFEPLNFASRDHIAALDGRLNQNWLVGAAVMYHEDGGAPFAYGATIPLWALIPRAVWPDKPDIGGGLDLVSEFTGIRFAEGTSIGAGQVLEFYINFGIPGVLIGFLGFGYLLMWLDHGIMRALAADDMRGLLMRAMPGLMLLEPQGNLLGILVSGVSAFLGAHVIVSLRFFGIPVVVRRRRKVA